MLLRLHATIVLSILATVATVAFTGAGTATARADDAHVLPLGGSGLPETRTTTTLAPGVTYTKIVRGYQSASEYWSVQPGAFQTEAEADSLAAELDSAGHPATVVEIDRRPVDDPVRGPLVWLVRAGRFHSQADAAAERQAIAGRRVAGGQCRLFG